MIDRQEVMEMAKEFGLIPEVIEKDYALGWLLAGIAEHPVIGDSWAFKGGTCLKKCFFETYRFSEDLDFTLTDPAHLEEAFLRSTFTEIAEWVYDNAGMEIPADTIRFEVYQNPRRKNSAQGRVGYRGPIGRKGDAPRIKLDLTDDEVLVLEPELRDVHHPYSDKPMGGIQVNCYAFEEVLAEKIRALTERLRPRDLYDVVHLYRREGLNPDLERVMQTLEEKCRFKGIDVPTYDSIANHPERSALDADWGSMLGHQLPVLPPLEQFWDELVSVFDWLHQTKEKLVIPAVPRGADMDESWQMPTMMQAWHVKVPMEIIRFSAANRLCVELLYSDKSRLIEPYSLRKTSKENIVLYAVQRDDQKIRAFNIEKIQRASATAIPFTPRYAIELTASSKGRI